MVYVVLYVWYGTWTDLVGTVDDRVYSFGACLGCMTIDQASVARRRGVMNSFRYAPKFFTSPETKLCKGTL